MAKDIAHHLVYGTLEDYLNGEELIDTDDERIRQRLSRWMVEEKGYSRQELLPRLYLETLFAKSFVRSTIELTVSVHEKHFMIIRYGPGSLVSRERAAIAAARVLNPSYRIPLAVVTNGEDAEIIDTTSGKIRDYGLQSVPERDQAEEIISQLTFLSPQNPEDREKELRILNAFDVERCCL